MKTAINISNPDAFYARLAAMHQGLDAEASLLLMSRLALLLANQIDDAEILEACLSAAERGPTAR